MIRLWAWLPVSHGSTPARVVLGAAAAQFSGARAVRRAAGQRVRAARRKYHSRSAVFFASIGPSRTPVSRIVPLACRIAAVGIAARAVVDRGDLDRVDVHVVAVGAERLGRPHHRQVAVDVRHEDALLVPLIAVAQDDQVQPLRGRAGDLDRVHLRIRQRLRRPLRARRPLAARPRRRASAQRLLRPSRSLSYPSDLLADTPVTAGRARRRPLRLRRCHEAPVNASDN